MQNLKENTKEKNPEKFVFQFFYDEPNTSKINKKVSTNIYTKYPYNKNNELRHNEYNCKDAHNHSFSDINNQLINYNSMLTGSNNYTNKVRKNKTKENNIKIQKLIKKLYNEGIKDMHKREIIYKENLMKKSEEYKKYPFHPNNSKKVKLKKNKCIKLHELNEKFYSKQVEWKKKKNKEYSQKKKYEEEIYLSQFSFKPNITQKYIEDDEKMITRNLNDMNNYILKRRNQIRYKKEDGFKLRDYRQNIDNNIQDKEPLTERIYYRNRNELNDTFVTTTRRQFKFSKHDFLRAVKRLHNEIRNLNL